MTTEDIDGSFPQLVNDVSKDLPPSVEVSVASGQPLHVVITVKSPDRDLFETAMATAVKFGNFFPLETNYEFPFTCAREVDIVLLPFVEP
jgi:hypothetical protein